MGVTGRLSLSSQKEWRPLEVDQLVVLCFLEVPQQDVWWPFCCAVCGTLSTACAIVVGDLEDDALETHHVWCHFHT